MATLAGVLFRLCLSFSAMPDLRVAIHAVDFVIRNVHLMHEVTVTVTAGPLNFGMAGTATLARDFATRGTNRFTGMAPSAVHVEALNVPVIKGHQTLLDDLIGHCVAKHTSGRGRFRILALEVAEDTGRTGYRHVLALHNLTMTGSAAKPLFTTEVSQMRRVIEENVSQEFLAGQQASFMTAQTGGIIDLSPGPGPVGRGEIGSDHGEGLEFLSHCVGNARRYMAVHASDIAVSRCRPRVIVRPHDMTGATELGLARDFHH
jgi:hypothetical protein